MYPLGLDLQGPSQKATLLVGHFRAGYVTHHPTVQGDFNSERWHLSLLTVKIYEKDLTSVLSQSSAWILVVLSTKSTTLIESLFGALGTSCRYTSPWLNRNLYLNELSRGLSLGIPKAVLALISCITKTPRSQS